MKPLGCRDVAITHGSLRKNSLRQTAFAGHSQLPTVTEPEGFFIRIDRLSIVTESHMQGLPDLIVKVLSFRESESTIKKLRHIFSALFLNVTS